MSGNVGKCREMSGSGVGGGGPQEPPVLPFYFTAYSYFWSESVRNDDVYFLTITTTAKELSSPGFRCTGGSDCCTAETPCGLDEGDCDQDEQCSNNLICGTDNCLWGGYDDCCMKMPGTNVI